MRLKSTSITNVPSVRIFVAEVESSFIKELRFIQSDDCGTTLEVVMNGGRRYFYGNVPSEIVGQVVTADSIGKAYNKYIKNIYPYVEMKMAK